MRSLAIAAIAACLLFAAAGASAQDEEPNACEIAAHASRAAVEIGAELADEGSGLFAEMARLAEYPCDDTPLYLRRFPTDVVHDGEMIFEEDWYLTCDGCAALPARHVFPVATLLLVDSLDQDRAVSIEALRWHVNECPFEW